MPRFEPFAALRFAPALDLAAVSAPPYDVLSEDDRDRLAASDAHNIVHVDVPRTDGDDGSETGDVAGGPHPRYAAAAAVLDAWRADGTLVRDGIPTFTIHRMRFTDDTGAAREVVGVLGALEVVDAGAGGVLPHERTTPKDSTDRLELTRATAANLSPVWGLSLRAGLTDLLREAGEEVGRFEAGGVRHVLERVSDAERVAGISAAVGGADVLIADGHHRYAVARSYRDETRSGAAVSVPGAELTLTFVGELAEDQLSVAAIHRLVHGLSGDEVADRLEEHFEVVPVTSDTEAAGAGELLAAMDELERLVLVRAEEPDHWLIPRDGAFDDVRALDGAWLEKALPGVEVTYQHGVDEVRTAVEAGQAAAGILIRPTSVAEIERTAREGLLMPPKSTFFTPKLPTGLVIREL